RHGSLPRGGRSLYITHATPSSSHARRARRTSDKTSSSSASEIVARSASCAASTRPARSAVSGRGYDLRERGEGSPMAHPLSVAQPGTLKEQVLDQFGIEEKGPVRIQTRQAARFGFLSKPLGRDAHATGHCRQR